MLILDKYVQKDIRSLLVKKPRIETVTSTNSIKETVIKPTGSKTVIVEEPLFEVLNTQKDDGNYEDETIEYEELEDIEILEEEEEAEGENLTEEVYTFDECDPDDPQPVQGTDYTIQRAVVKLKPNTDADNLLQCPHCDYSTNRRFLLSRHLNTHSVNLPHKCSICDKAFKTNAALINHTNVHMGRKPYKCRDCESSFTTAGELTRHTRYKHTGEKPHKCSECSYASVELSKLRRHMRCHTGERPYQCPHCTYASADTFKLKRHLRTHTVSCYFFNMFINIFNILPFRVKNHMNATFVKLALLSKIH